MSPLPKNDPKKPSPKKASLIFRLALLAAVAVSGALLVKFTPLGELMAEERVLAMSETLRQNPWTPVLLILAFAATGPVGLPVSPIVLAGGVVFGPLLGTFYNSIGLVANAMLTFYFGRFLGREAVTRLAGPKLRRAEAVFERRGFWPLVQVRFLPIPTPVISYGAALAGVSTPRFLITSALGLTPACAAHTYFAPKLILAVLAGEKPILLLIQYAGIFVILNVIAAWPQIREALRRRRRYKELMELRQRRNAAPSN